MLLESVNSLELGVRLVKADGFVEFVGFLELLEFVGSIGFIEFIVLVEMARLLRAESPGSQFSCSGQDFTKERSRLHLLKFCFGVNQGLYR